jgi:hypothetical protein
LYPNALALLSQPRQPLRAFYLKISAKIQLSAEGPFEDLPHAASYYNGECCGALIAPIAFPIKRVKETPYKIYILGLVDA